MLVVNGIYDRDKSKRLRYLCTCDCGNTCVVKADNLRSGHTKSCGCLRSKPSSRRIDLSGRRFGHLTAISFNRSNEAGTTLWDCVCDCGNKIIVSYNNLISGNTSSCGCWHEKHGETYTRLYKCWSDMKARCYYKNDYNYKNYGGRGISVSDIWRNSFLAFRNWALSNGYNDNLTIDRIDVNGNYTPENCRWIPISEQQSNKRTNVFIEYNGESLTLKQIAKKYAEPKGISYKTFWYRLCVAKWDLERCLTQPVK